MPSARKGVAGDAVRRADALFRASQEPKLTRHGSLDGPSLSASSDRLVPNA